MEVSEIIEMVDIKEYIEQYVDLELKNGEWWGLSCFKDEKTPSFSVRPDAGMWYDFSSGKGGNVIDFIKLYHRCSLYEAVNKLKKYAGIEGDVDFRSTRLLSTSIAKKFKQTSKPVKQAEYKILRDDYMELFEDPGSFADEWRSEGISDASMRKFQVKYDSFQNRLVFPIRSMDGKIINISGRTLVENPKLHKIRKYSYYYPLGLLDTIYGFFENKIGISKKKEIILFEGAKSVMIADSWGIDNAAAILTSHLNPQQFKILIQLGVRVVFALDEDVDIRKDENIVRLKHYVNVEWVYPRRDRLLSEKMAPVDAGKEAWDSLYARRISL